MSVLRHISEIDGAVSRRDVTRCAKRKKKIKDISCSSINRGARGNYSNDYSGAFRRDVILLT